MKVMIDISTGRLAIEGDGPELLKVLQAARELAPDITQIQIITSGGDQGSMAQAETQDSRDSHNGPPPLSRYHERQCASLRDH